MTTAIVSPTQSRDAAMKAHDLRHMLAELSNLDESAPHGLGTLASMADVIADTLDRYHQSVLHAND